MKPYLVSSLLAFAFPVALLAQSSVWKITKGDSTVYLGGTCHVLRAADFPLPKEFDQAFAAASKVYFETDLARARSPEMQQLVLENAFFTDGTTLNKVLTPAAWASAQNYTSALGVPPDKFDRMKPWFLVVMMTMFELQKIGVTSEGVDAHYFNRLGPAGKTSGELETFEDHVQFLFNLGSGHESELLENSAEEVRGLSTLFESMIAAWRSGDLVKIDALMLAEMRTKYPAIYQQLLVQRNHNWMPRIEALFESPKVELVLVGAAHLAGKDGLVQQLEARGYQVEQIKAAAPSTE